MRFTSVARLPPLGKVEVHITLLIAVLLEKGDHLVHVDAKGDAEEWAVVFELGADGGVGFWFRHKSDRFFALWTQVQVVVKFNAAARRQVFLLPPLDALLAKHQVFDGFRGLSGIASVAQDERLFVRRRTEAGEV